MLRVLTILGTRPEAIKLAPVLKELRGRKGQVDSVLCVTAQHRQMLDPFLSLFQLEPAVDLNLMEENQSPASVTGRAIAALTGVLERIKPDWVLVQGDTTTAMVGALAAFYGKIPVGHVEAGLRTQNRYSPFPEEMNRRLIGAIATYHFAPTRRAALALRREGVPQKEIFITGNTVIDAMQWVVSQAPSASARNIFLKLGIDSNGAARKIQDPPRLIIVTAHRRENLGGPLENICDALRELARHNPDVRIVYPVHLNPNVRETVYRMLAGQEHIFLVDPLPYESFAHLLKASFLVLTDSGGIQEEAPALGKPVLVLRSETERPEAAEAGAARVIGTSAEKIIHETQKLLSDEDEYRRMAQAVNPYGDGRASQRIVAVLLGAAGLVSRD